MAATAFVFSMREDLKDFILLTHTGCLDGAMSAILFIHAGGDKKNIRYVPAGQIEAALEDGELEKLGTTPLLMVDVCPSTKDLAGLLSARQNTFVIDHHASSKKFCSLPGFLIDVNNGACGCENFRRWLVRNGLERLDSPAFIRACKVVDDHDRWQRRIPFSLELPKLMSFVGQKDFVDRFMDIEGRFGVEKDSYFTSFERDVVRIIERNQTQKFKTVFEHFRVQEEQWQGRTIRVAYVLSSEPNVSELLQTYLANHPEVDVACQVNFDTEKVGIRSRESVDISVWAGEFGGGGHVNAAGFPLPEGLVERIVDELRKD